MSSIRFAAAFGLLFTAACVCAQPAESGQLMARSAAPVTAPSDAAVFAGLFGPVSLPADPALSCPAPASSSSGATTPVIAAPAAGLPSAPQPSSALPNSSAMPAVAMIKPAEPRPDSIKRVLFSNSVMYGATFFHAFGRQAEIDACKREAGLKNGVFATGPYKGQAPATQAKFYAIALPIDAAVSVLSLLARHKGWHAFEIAAPLSAATAHVTAGAFKLAAGCY